MCMFNKEQMAQMKLPKGVGCKNWGQGCKFSELKKDSAEEKSPEGLVFSCKVLSEEGQHQVDA